MTEEESNPYKFVPYAEQTDPLKVHRILISIDYPPEKVSPLCNLREDHKKIWGDNPRLELVAPGAPMLKDQFGFLIDPGFAGIFIEKARAVRLSFEFPEPETRKGIEKFLPPEDILKVDEFADAIRREPYFIPDSILANSTMRD